MRKLTVLCIALSLAFIMVMPAMATKPGEDVNPNGFPSGPHFNLNIIGKDTSFVCPDQEYLTDEYGNLILDGSGNPIPVYGGVIFIPEYSAQAYDVKIVMESGRKGPKSAPGTPELQVTDWCSGFAPNDEARLLLPANEAGYDVYARVLAKPTDDPDITFCDPTLVYAEDEFGNDLVWLGLVTSTGFQTPTYTFTRSKGKSTAIDITGLFLWTGTVCYVTAPSDGSPYVETAYCAKDNDLDGIYDEYNLKDPLNPCPEGYVEVTLYCVSYTDKWIFNIADFVEYFYDIDNNGVKLIQVRFYPR